MTFAAELMSALMPAFARSFVTGLDGGEHFGVKADRVALGQSFRICPQIEIDDGSHLEPQRANDLHERSGSGRLRRPRNEMSC